MDECHVRIILIGFLYSYHIAQIRKTMPFELYNPGQLLDN